MKGTCGILWVQFRLTTGYALLVYDSDGCPNLRCFLPWSVIYPCVIPTAPEVWGGDPDSHHLQPLGPHGAAPVRLKEEELEEILAALPALKALPSISIMAEMFS